MRFDWQNAYALEDISKRTHQTKDFVHPTDPKQRILIQSSGLLHYYDGGFKDIPDLKFPEGKEIKAESAKHFMVDLPAWGTARVEDGGKQVRVYDKKNYPIFVFKNPLVVGKGKSPYKVVGKDGVKVRETKNRKEDLGSDERIENSDNAIDVAFEVENNKLYMKLPVGLTYPLEAYDDTDTSSTNNKDAHIASASPDENRGGLNDLNVNRWSTSKMRTLIHFSLASGSGAISAIKLYLSCSSEGDPGDVTVHQLTQTSWVEGDGSAGSGATWNKYDGSNTWTGGGGEGDYGGTVHTTSVTTTGWKTWDLIEPGASGTGLTLDWESQLHLLLRTDEAGGSNQWGSFDSRDKGGNDPYIQITYTPPAVAAAPPQSSMAAQMMAGGLI